MFLLLFESKFEYKLSSYNVILRNIDSYYFNKIQRKYGRQTWYFEVTQDKPKQKQKKREREAIHVMKESTMIMEEGGRSS